VAALSSQMSGPLVDHMTAIYGQWPQRAVLGVQLDERSGKDGARIQEVSPGGAAAEAGLHVGDVITQINGTDVKGDSSARQVIKAMRSVEPDSKVKVRVTRGGKPQDFVVTARRGMTFLGMHEPPIPAIPPIPPLPPGIRGEGGVFGPMIIRGPLGEMELASLTPQLGRYFGTDKGVLVVRAPKDFKLEDGDVILAIDGREPTSGSHATRILGSYQPGEKIAIRLMRQQKTMNVETTLPERGSRIESGRTTGPDRRVRMTHRESDATT
jgi:S1-C subfamily serine protease